ncbi:SDR family NAD(P)-dependent oxidoreductase [Streptomyces sp. NPDC003300]|uniref:SDR family NAD(P)-dependent oxidoreductase n=3 Tax=unclassified Streptomyces TaxID=2593676 RepID=UPI0033A2FFCE
MTNDDKLVDYLKRVAADLHQTRQELQEVKDRESEPIAIVGMACRFPGHVGTPEDFWRLLDTGGDAIADFPSDRGWDTEALYDADPDAPGKTYLLKGGFLDGAGDFDAELFGVSPREALGMDPQQRLVLESSWEVLERAGIDPSSLKGTKTGVFVGAAGTGYLTNMQQVPEGVEGYTGTGSFISVISGRVSYSLGLEGPALTVDTACSSSLVALHLAVQSLRNGESTLALVGGVAVMPTPWVFVDFSRQRGLAPDGRCKAFAAGADGTAWSEGVGMLLVERLSDARRNGHNVLAVVRGSALNQDGASNGLTAPNGPSQQRVIRAALANAGLTGDEVDAVEAHGTGTTLGDPIEAQALLATYGKGRTGGRPLWLGSVKSNLGHTAHTAGMAGVIKMVLALQEEKLPRTLHIDAPTSNVDWSAGAVRLLEQPVDWKRGDRPRRAAVSSFGISGTNAHVILEDAPQADEPVSVDETPSAQGPLGELAAVPWVVSGRSAAALRGQAARLAAFAADSHELAAPAHIGRALAVSRAALEHRAVTLADDVKAMVPGLAALSEGVAASGVVSGVVRPGAGRVAFVFPGQGSQWAGMALGLLDSSPVFGARLAECDAALLPYVGSSVVEAIREGALDDVVVVQGALWAVMVSLAEVWRSVGVEPGAVIGHSQGEIAAACVAGALSVEDAARVVALRAKAIRGTLSGNGGMVSVALPADAVRERIARWDGRISVASVNGPSSTVVSGEPQALVELLTVCKAEGVRARRIDVDYASHSAQVDAIRDEVVEALSGIEPQSSQVPFYSTVTGARIDTSTLDADYWVTNLRQEVRFDETVRALLADGFGYFIESSPHPVLAVGLAETFEDAGSDAVALGTLRREEGGQRRFLTSLAEGWVRGLPVDWRSVFAGTPARRVDLPTYAFQHQRYWLESGSLASADASSLGLGAADHPLLGAAVQLADENALLLTGRISLRTHAWLADHAVNDTVLLPGAAFVELALRAGEEIRAEQIDELILEAPLVIPEGGAVQLQVAVGGPDADGRREITIHSRGEDGIADDEPWTRHAVGVLSTERSAESVGLTDWPPAGSRPVPVEDFYARVAAAGYGYGPAFRGLRAAWRRGDDVYAEVTLPDAAAKDAERFALHPALLDAVLHAVSLLDGGTPESAPLRLPYAWEGVALSAVGASRLRLRVRPLDGGAVALTLADAAGAPVGEVQSVVLRETTPEQLRQADGTAGRDGLFALDWTPLPVSAGAAVPAPGPVLTLGGAQDVTDVAALLAGLDAGTLEPPAHVITRLGPGDTRSEVDSELPSRVRTAVTDALALVQAWLADERLNASRLVVVTTRAVSTGPDDEVADLVHAPVWGLLRTAQSEAPDRFLLVDTDGTAGTDDTAGTDGTRGTNAASGTLAAAVASAVDLGEPQIAIRDGVLLAPRFARVAPAGPAPVPLRDDGTVLITGGTGTLGRLLAEHLVSAHGVRHLLLVGRQGRAATGAPELERRLLDAGASSVEIAACDVADRASLAALLEAIPSDRPLTGAVHAAGVLDDGVVSALTPDQVARVLAPKVDAAVHLHELTRHLDLSLFVLFSSIAGVLGNPGQAGYAAANVFLDALATRRRAEGLPVTDLIWGYWSEASELTARLGDADVARYLRMGVTRMSPEQGLALFDAAASADGGSGVHVVSRLDLRALRSAARAGEPVLPLYRGLVRGRPRRATDVGGDSGSLLRALTGLTEEDQLRYLLDLVRGRAATVLGYADPSAVEPARSFKEFGFDSLTGLQLRNALAAATGLRLPATLVFDYPTPRALAGFLRTLVLGDERTGQVAARRGMAGPLSARETADPVVIVGMACRYPGGVGSPEELWSLVASGGDAVSGFPADRGWDVEGLFDPNPGVAGRSYAREGGFLYGAGEFDAGFFGVSPREALSMDPQQRLLLEASWEVLERAGIDPGSLKGSSTGVFTGVMHHDYAVGADATANDTEGYALMGSSPAAVSGRVSYTFGFEGPAMTVDTACSSSLVAMHLAAQALRSGECSLALAGGVTVMSTPTLFVEFSRQRGMAPDGRSKAFSAAADGAGWGEGVGVLLLERLSDARRNGHRVLAVMRGSAVNQDGASNGLTAPNGPSQERVIRAALESGGLTAADVDVVEAHGTGTTLGDPIEAQALLATYGQERGGEDPLWLGSVKSNIGHTQAAAGVAGVIKMVEAMRHEVLPKSLYADEPTPHVDWTSGAVELLAEAMPWTADTHPRRAGISAFGASGTNAHVILEEPGGHAAADTSAEPEREPEVGPDACPLGSLTVVPWVVSARSADALRGQAGRLASFAGTDDAPALTSVGRELALSRAALPHRSVVLAADAEHAQDVLGALAEGAPAARLVSGATRSGDGRVAFVFPGQGSQWAGMAMELLASSPVFAERLAECDAALLPYVGSSVVEAIREGALDDVVVVQGALWAVMVSLAAVWRSVGVEPGAVIGHSQGEIAAACVAGALSVEDAARVVALRAKAIRGTLSGNGGMVSVALPAQDVRERIARWDGRISVASVNGPSSTVVSGEPQALAELLMACEAEGVRARRIDVDYASHSAQVDAIRDEVVQALSGITPTSSEVPFYSTVTGARIDTSTLDADYWVTNLRQEVRFDETVRALLSDGFGYFVESSPHPVLAVGLAETFEDAGSDAVALGTLRRDEGGQERFLTSLAEGWVRGLPVDWRSVFAGTPDSTGAGQLALPTYAFQHEHYWLTADAARAGDPSGLGQAAADHPLLGAVVRLAGSDQVVLTGRLSLASHAWLGDHRVEGTVLVPGAALAEWALRAADEVGAGCVEELTLQAPLVVPESGGVQVQVSVGAPDADGRRELGIHSRPEGTGESAPWALHAVGTLAVASDTAEATEDLTAWPPPGAVPVPVEDFYAEVGESGYGYGPAFQGLRAAWRHGDDVYAEAALPDELHQDAAKFGIHPALLDAALHGIVLLRGGSPAELTSLRLPFAWTDVALGAVGATSVRVRLRPAGEDAASVLLADAEGAPVVSVASLALRTATADQIRVAAASAAGTADGLYRVDWVPAALSADSGAPDGCVFLERLSDIDAAHPVPPLVGLVLPPASVSGDVPGAVAEAVTGVLGLVQEWLVEERFADSRLVLVTRGAVSTHSGEPVADLVHAPVWGLVRSALAENPGRFLLIDSDADVDVDVHLASGQTAVRDTLAYAVGVAVAAGEPQVAVRGGEVLVPRLVRAPAGGGGLVPPAEGAWRLVASGDGTLDGLSVEPDPAAEAPLVAGQVRVDVRAAGVNFRDVLINLGMYPDPDAYLGTEGAGVVVEVGPGVAGVVVGDRVMGLLPESFGPLAVVDERLVVRVPEGWSFEQAAAVPVVFMTAWFGLADLGELQSGHRVLIHAAAGGVGMAATQLARHWGAEVFGTASEGKWDTLRLAGLAEDHIASSRTLDFEDAFRQATDGHGMDVVLNSLAREFVDASLRLLPRGGRFLEMGKTDIRDPEAVVAEHPGVTYHPYALTDISPDRLGEILRELAGLFAEGVLEPLPVRVWDVRRAGEALRFMSQARHVGKVVLSLPRRVDAASAVVITGGTGLLGGLVARHLVASYGVRDVVLAGRRGANAPGAEALVAELEAAGARVEVVACDVAVRDEVAGLLARFGGDRPLGGVVHCAGALDDGLVPDLDAERIRSVLGAKVDAAWHLHELTRDLDLSLFVLFSSLAGVVGTAGQGNYAAANTFLDALAGVRRTSGAAGVSMAWGHWATDSELTGSLGEVDRARLARSGVVPMSVEQGIGLFDVAVGWDVPLAVTARLTPGDAQSTGEAFHALTRELTTASVRKSRAVATSSARADSSALVRRLSALSAAERTEALRDVVRTHVAAVLGHGSPAAVDPERAFKELGFDSLTGVELRNRLGAAIGQRLAATVVFDHPTPDALAAHLADELGLGAATADDRAPAGALPAAAGLDDDPVAVVAMTCRFPGGADSPEQLWDLVASGTDAISGFPTDRGWDLADLYDPDPARSGKSYAQQGGFVRGATDFDAELFGISPREALAMDPQQRLVLEAAWEAVERAGIDVATLRGSRTGVFIGAVGTGYGQDPDLQQRVEGYSVTGNVLSVISGRVSYVLGLEGPAMTVDTACSSSLVALHLAAQALRAGECSLALVGGVTVMPSPFGFVEFSRQRVLSPDGRCRAFAADADGTGFSEGVGMLVVERLSEARRNGHRVLAVMRGSAVNQDGASNGLTAPNGPSQQRVIRAALANAGLTGDEVDAVEAHGTGTNLGDPIEAQALLATYGRDHARDQPLWLGSIKSNIGHTQAAAGVAGLIKMVMAMGHGTLPSTLHAEEPSPEVDWSSGRLRLLNAATPWPDRGRPRRAAVSSFGISGTNAHVILEEPPAAPVEAVELAHPGSEFGERAEPGTSDAPAVPAAPAPAAVVGDPPGTVVPWVLSAKSAAALRAQAGRLAAFVADRPDTTDAEIGHALATTRTVLEQRAVVLAGDRAQAAAALGGLADGTPTAGAVTGAADVRGRVAFVFPGQGSQWKGMGAELLDTSAVFAERFAQCDAALRVHLDWSVTDVVRGVDGAPSPDLIEVLQPVLFAVNVSLVELWRSVGVEPAAVVGSSQGEIAAALVAGALTMEDAAEIIALRSALFAAELVGNGAVASVALPVAEVEARTAAWGGRLDIAGRNGPTAVTVAGDTEALTEFVAACEADGVRARVVGSTVASHCAQVEPLRERIMELFAHITPRRATVPFYSTVTGGLVDTTTLDNAYWYLNARRPVDFQAAVLAMESDGFRFFVEASAHPVLTTAMAATFEDAERDGVAVGTLRRDEGGMARFTTSVAEGFVRGLPGVDWRPLAPGSGGTPLALPTYAFQRRRFWLDDLRDRTAPTTSGTGDLADAGFWAAVERGDLEHLAGELELDSGEDELATVLPALSSWRRRSLDRTALDRWRYGIAWRALDTANARAPRGRWTILSFPDEPWAAAAGDALAAAGTTVTHIEIPADRTDRAALAELLRTVEADGVLSLLALGDSETGGQGADGSETGVPKAGGSESVGATNGGAEEAAAHEVPGASAVDGTGLAVSDASAPGHAPVGSGTPSHAPVSSTALRGHAPAPAAAGLSPAARVTLALAQAAADAELTGRLWAATAEGVRTAPGDAGPRSGQAEVWGLGRAIALEQPRQWGGLVDLPPVPDASAAVRLAAVLGGLPGPDGTADPAAADALSVDPASGGSASAVEDQVAVRASGIHGRRLIRTPLGAAHSARAAAWRPDGTVLITGGTGGIGARVARRLAAEGAPHLLLAGRRGPDAPGAAELRAELEAAGAGVTFAACDVADRSEVAALLAGVPADRPLSAVFHAAGAPQTYLAATDTTDEDITRIASAKIAGARHLDDLLGGTPLDAFVLFSSNAGVWGSGGQAVYAAANAHLDALAERRRALGRTATSLAWGAWDGGGMMEAEGAAAYMESRGVLAMDPERAATALLQAVAHDETFVAVADVDWERFVLGFTALRPSPLLAELPEVQAALRTEADQADSAAPTTAGAEFAARLATLSEPDQLKNVLDLVRDQAASVLQHADNSSVRAGRTFKDLGFDSLTAVELRNRLSTATGLKLPASLVFDHPTPTALAQHLRTRFTTGAASAATGPVSTGGTGTGSVLDELDALAGAVAALPADGEETAEVVGRLEELLWQVRQRRDGRGEIESATAEEMFDLLDRELGNP